MTLLRKSARIKDRLRGSRGILFDLDNTLYPKERGVFEMIRERINVFVADLTGLDPEGIRKLRREYVEHYGTTLGGLMNRERVDPDGFLEFVHDVPVEDMLDPDPELFSFLDSIDLPKVIFTNASHRHAQRVLNVLGIENFFQGICDLAKTGYVGKPHRLAFDAAAGMLSRPLGEMIFIDDVPEYIQAGCRYGALTVHIGTGDNRAGHFQSGKVTDLAGEFAEMPWYKKSPMSKVQRKPVNGDQ